MEALAYVPELWLWLAGLVVLAYIESMITRRNR
jgi:hypothetical protein